MEDAIRLLTEYTESFGEIGREQAKKLGMLLTRELNKVGSTLLMGESMKRQIENMEGKRQEHFTSQGFVGKRLKELVKESSGKGREALRQSQRRLEDAIGNARYYNSESSKLTKGGLSRLREDNLLQDNPSGVYNPQSLPPCRGQRLERKT